VSRGNGFRAVFAVSLVALLALAVWWSVFFRHAVELERQAALDRLEAEVRLAAAACGRAAEAPAPGAYHGSPALEVVPADGAGELSARCLPDHPGVAIRPQAWTVETIDRKVARRRFMVQGESALMLALLGVCWVMLYRFVREERRGAERMREFIASVTHEMKTPLAGVKSLLETLAAGRVPAGEQARLFGLGLQSVERLEHLVDNVLVSGRLRVASLEVHVEALPLREQLDGFVRHRRRYLVGSDARLELDWRAGDGDLRVAADANALRIVLENLTDNAFKYGGTPSHVTIAAARDGERARVSVCDRGIGFTPEQAAALFTPFRRAGERGEARAQHGTGLGLSIAAALAGAMGAELSAASDGPGRGACFTITLRIATE
jgi:signal transduction histidine kinase